MERLIVFTNSDSPVSEAYRVLCMNVLASLDKKKILELAGVTDNSNACLIMSNLAVAMAQAGKSVLVIDCNLREPKLHELFSLQNSGLSDCLSMEDDYENYVQATKQNNLFVLTAGTATVNNPSEALLSLAMQDILNEIRKVYDIILIDIPSAGTVSDAVSLGTKTDGVLLVLNNKEDKVEQAQKVKEMFTQANVPVLGCVLNKA